MIGVLAFLPGRTTLLPGWVTYVVGAVALTPIVAVGLTPTRPWWMRIERTTTLSLFVVATLATLANLAHLIHIMIHKSRELGGLQLLGSSVAIWLTNVLAFSLLYWQIDRGGPEARMNTPGARPDWLFPQTGASADDVPAGWRPTFVDYLYLAYSTATAFSTTEVAPLTSRAKMLMMLESSISLLVILVVASRAINILSS
ncbi:MAG TPA: hypothetical protein VGF42_06555 [Caulobacteraceae bacterium]